MWSRFLRAVLVMSAGAAMGCAAGGAHAGSEEVSPLASSGALAESPVRRDSGEMRLTTVVVVRHAEKATGQGDDPHLSDAGAARARALARALEDAGVTGVITTNYMRTAETGAPTAADAGVTPEVVRVWNSVPRHIGDVVAAIRRHEGGVVLVVGHSNTVAAIVEALGAERPEEICDSEYDRMEFVSVAPNGRARRISSRYGAPTPVEAGCALR